MSRSVLRSKVTKTAVYFPLAIPQRAVNSMAKVLKSGETQNCPVPVHSVLYEHVSTHKWSSII